MSTASALLNLIAPAAPTTPQGSATIDASVFEGLLAAMMGGDMGGDGEGDTVPAPEKTDIQTDLTAALVAAPVPAPLPQTQPLLLVTGTDLSNTDGENVDVPAVQPAITPAKTAAPQPEVQPDIAPVSKDGDTAAKDATPPTPLVQPAVPTPVDAAAEVVAPPVQTPVKAATPVEPLVQPGQPPVDLPADDAATKPTDAGPQVRPAAEPASSGKTADVAPEVRPAIKSTLSDEPQVQPLPSVEPEAKAATTEPLVRPTAEPADPGRRPVQLDQVRRLTATDRPIPAELLQRLNAAGDLLQHQTDIAPAEVATPVDAAEPALSDTVAKVAEAAPLTQPPAAAEVVIKAAQSEPRPVVQPLAPTEASAPKGGEATVDPILPETLAAPEDAPALTELVQPPVPEAESKTGEAPRPESPNLRALAERASRPVETNAAVDTGAPVTPVTTTPQGAAPAATATGVTPMAEASKPAAEAAVTEIAEVDAAAASDAPVEVVGPDAAPSAQTTHTAREALPPTLSRVAVEATAQIAAQILRKLEGRSTRFEMSLTPDELGRVDIKLDIDAEGRMAARLAFDNPAAAADLKGRVDELRRQLEQQGFQLSDDAFEFTQRDSGSSAFDRGQDSRSGQDGSQSRAFAAASRLNTEADAVAQPPRWQALSLTPTGVDMKV